MTIFGVCALFFFLLEELNGYWLFQAHVLCALDGQPVPGVVVHHLGHSEEPSGEITELEVSIFGIPTYLHMHESLGAPGMIHIN